MIEKGGKRTFNIDDDDDFYVSFKCKECLVFPETKREWVMHFNKCHFRKIKNWPYQCDCCGKKHELLVDVINHHEREHLGMHFECKKCTEYFGSHADAYTHPCVKCCQNCGKLYEECKCDSMDPIDDDEELSEIQKLSLKRTGRWLMYCE